MLSLGNCKAAFRNEFDCAENCCGWCVQLRTCLSLASNASCPASSKFVTAMRCAGTGPWDREDTIILVSIVGAFAGVVLLIGVAYCTYKKKCRARGYAALN